MSKRNTAGLIAGIASAIVLAAFVIVLVIPASREVFKTLSSEHPYIMGFIKFGLLATVGEVLALTIKKKSPQCPFYIGWRMLIWA